MTTTRYLGMLLQNVGGLTWYVPMAPQTISTFGWQCFSSKREAMAWIRGQVRG